MELGERIVGWREAAGLSRLELAKKIGVTAPAVYQWEYGLTAPAIVHLERFAEILGVTMERFYGRVPAKWKAA